MFFPLEDICQCLETFLVVTTCSAQDSLHDKELSDQNANSAQVKELWYRYEDSIV